MHFHFSFASSDLMRPFKYHNQTNLHQLLWFSHNILLPHVEFSCRVAFALFLQVFGLLSDSTDLDGDFWNGATLWLGVKANCYNIAGMLGSELFGFFCWAWQQEHALFINIMTQTNCHTICQQPSTSVPACGAVGVFFVSFFYEFSWLLAPCYPNLDETA